MVTHGTLGTAARPGRPVPRSAISGPGGVVRFTVRDVLAMVEMGLIPEDATTELLHGVLVLKDRSDLGKPLIPHGKKHRKCVVRLTSLAARINGPTQHVQIQLPLVCGEDEAPEPDFAVIRGLPEDYDDGHPAGADSTCVVEVSDSSLERDADETLSIYAAAGVPQYVILNLRNRTAQVYVDPDSASATYRSPSVLAEGDDLHLALADGGRLTVRVRDLLP